MKKIRIFHGAGVFCPLITLLNNNYGNKNIDAVSGAPGSDPNVSCEKHRILSLFSVPTWTSGSNVQPWRRLNKSLEQNPNNILLRTLLFSSSWARLSLSPLFSFDKILGFSVSQNTFSSRWWWCCSSKIVFAKKKGKHASNVNYCFLGETFRHAFVSIDRCNDVKILQFKMNFEIKKNV